MQLIKKRLSKEYFHLAYGVFTLIGGIYVFFHLNYLDNPQITPPPPLPHFERLGADFVDDWWFASLLVLAGFFLLLGVFLGQRKWRDIGVVIAAPLYGAMAFAFAWRGLLDQRFNLTWVSMSLAFVLLICTAMRGDRRHD
ncbi:hypothetical protein [Loigolactobacillus backii]|uniref:hypothetical protein n=1 Tax=Loigolactobacillus backii TaxID=375175 RepID=UPI0007F069D6|nr:hypothetical protein [Loigolactobacillus backii]ANK60016.1 hypothetical protein AYR52_06915 [Loigolactobacillus backii]